MGENSHTPSKDTTKMPAEEESGNAVLRKFSPEELEQILSEHEKWLESGEGLAADLSFSNLEGANLTRRRLDYANLQGCVLEHAYLCDASLQGTDLRQANLKQARMTGSSLKDARLQNAEFLGNEFAGSNLTGAKLSEENPIYKPLAAVEEVSKNARGTFFVFLIACAYCWLTIATTMDVKLITDSASSRLPVIGTDIPIVSFYFAAPLVLMVVYVYLHFYLHHLWKALALLPAKFPDGRNLDEQAYPWLVNAVVRRHYKILRQQKSLLARIEEFGTIILTWWLGPITLIAFWARYLPRHDWAGTGLHIFFLIASVSLAMIFYRSAASTIKPDLPEGEHSGNFGDPGNLRFAAAISLTGALFILLSYGAINGIRSNKILSADLKVMVPKFFDVLGYDVFADLRETDVSSKPPDYWRIKDKDDRINSVKGAYLKNKDLRYADMFRAFLPKSILRNANLKGARLRKANLQIADIRGAQLQKSDLRAANLKGADLREAKLMKAVLAEAQLQNANLGLAFLQGADLNRAGFRNTDFRCTNLVGVKNLNVDSLAEAKTLYKAKMDTGIYNQILKRWPHLLEKPREHWTEPNLIQKCQ